MSLTRRIRCFVILACALACPSSQAQQRDDYGGLRDVMLRAFGDWRKAHDGFDSTFSAQMKAILTMKPEEVGNSDFCRQDQKGAIAAATIALAAQLDAQKRYYEHHSKDAEKAVNDQEFLKAKIKSQEKQRLDDLKVAQEELNFLLEQRDQLRSAGTTIPKKPPEPPRKTADQNADTQDAGPTKPPEVDKPTNLEQALKELESTIQLRQEKVDTLRAMKTPLDVTLESLEKSRRNFETRLRECQDSLAVVEVQRRYWRAFYEMRATQVVEYCGQSPLQRPQVQVIK